MLNRLLVTHSFKTSCKYLKVALWLAYVSKFKVDSLKQVKLARVKGLQLVTSTKCSNWQTGSKEITPT